MTNQTIATTTAQDATMQRRGVSILHATQPGGAGTALRVMYAEDGRVVSETVEANGAYTRNEIAVDSEEWGDPAGVSEPADANEAVELSNDSRRVDGEPSDAHYAAFGRKVAAIFGSSIEWDSDITSAVDEAAFSPFGGGVLGMQLGDQDAAAMKLWRDVADLVGVDYEADEDEADEA